ncbi:hypothetical protein ACAG25_16275 [Mycobacterium sp. pV006]|uniref:hypothetical protein n=1 Tax=Mycobacterium sp. pV006 TaxID=3238983 RepID=UPI00351BD19B
MTSQSPSDLVQQGRAIRLLLATLDGDEDRADAVLDEDATISPRTRALTKDNAVELAKRLEADSGRDAAREALERALLGIQSDQEEHRDPIGHTWFVSVFAEPAEGDGEFRPDDDR